MSLPAGVLNESYGQDVAVVRTKTQWVWLAILLAALAYFPFIASNYLLGTVVTIGVMIISAMGLNLTLGYCGQISAAQSAFMAVGGFTAAILETKLGVPFFLALPCAALSTGLVGLVFAIPSVRTKGFYLTLSTLAAQIVIMWVILRWRDLTESVYGIRVPAVVLGPLSFDNTRSFYYIVLAMLILAVYFTVCLVKSRVGRAFMAIRDNELSAEALGIDVFRYKLLAFFVGCAFAGVSGSLYVHFMGVAQHEQFSLWQSIWLLGMILIGGMGTVTGPIFGVLFIKGLEELSYNLSHWVAFISPALAQGASIGVPEVVFGTVIILFLVFEPYGLAHRWQIIKSQYRIWPFAHQEK